MEKIETQFRSMKCFIRQSPHFTTRLEPDIKLFLTSSSRYRVDECGDYLIVVKYIIMYV